jgi:hypothetical protein
MDNQPSNSTVSSEEEARRRKVVSKANWCVAMEGLGEPTPEYNALSELWITGKITREELRGRRRQQVMHRIGKRR